MQVIIRKIVYLLTIIHNELLNATKREVIKCDNPLFILLIIKLNAYICDNYEHNILYQMSKSDIFRHILSAVIEETEIPEEKILSDSRTTEVVDARTILVNLLIESGFYPSQIAGYLNKSISTIHNLVKYYSIRQKTNKLLSIYSQNIRKKLFNK